MTTPAIGKIIAAEGFFIVMAARAALRVFRRKVHGGNERSSYLVASPCSGFDAMTSRAVESVTGVTKRRRLINPRPFGGSAAEFSGLVTGIARSNILLAAFRFRRMTLKTRVMRV